MVIKSVNAFSVPVLKKKLWETRREPTSELQPANIVDCLALFSGVSGQ